MTTENMTNSLYENLNAMMKSGQIWAEGLSEISKTFAKMAQAHLDANLAMMKALTNSKSPQETLSIQNDYIKKATDSTISDSKSLSDTTHKLAHDSMIAIKQDGRGDGKSDGMSSARQKAM
jgi:phasin family protein